MIADLVLVCGICREGFIVGCNVFAWDVDMRLQEPISDLGESHSQAEIDRG